MKKKINAVKVKDLVISIQNTMERNLTNVQEMLDLDLNDLIEIVNKLSDKEKELFFHTIINTQLKKLESLKEEEFKNVLRNVDEITDYYTSKKDGFDYVVEEGDYIADQLLHKVIGCNNYKLDLPVDISVVKEYCFSTELKEEQFADTFMWIALRYIAISRCLSWKKWEEEYNKSKELSSKK